MKNIAHILSLKGIGGVQQAFISYHKYAKQKSKYKHFIFSNHDVDKEYGIFDNYFKIKNNYLKFLYHLISKDTIMHFHNKLPDMKVYLLLKFLPARNIVFHEHGTAWNVSSDKDIKLYKYNANRADKIIVNSIATKYYIMQRFDVDESKISLAYYGFEDPNIIKIDKKVKTLQVGFIGRFDIFKGINALIEAAKILHNKDITFLIAGDGNLNDKLRIMAKGYSNIKFIGRVVNPIKFINNLDVLIVPSIREPLGIINIEAGLCKVPVIATDVDGIPEVITTNVSGILIKATQNIDYESEKGLPPLPSFVINTKNYTLEQPKELNPQDLANAIMQLANDEELRKKYGENLYNSVIEQFDIENYYKELESIYDDFK